MSEQSPGAIAGATTELFFDYGPVSRFAHEYLATYYQTGPTDDERALIQFVSERLARGALPELENGRIEHFDAACGPTLHHSLLFSRYADRLWMGDFLPENLDAVERWRKNLPDAHDWSHYSQFILEQQHASIECALFEEEARAKIAGLIPCDFRASQILASPQVFSSVGCFYGAEVVALDADGFGDIMRRLASLLCPGGWLFLSCLCEARSYLVGEAHANQVRLPTAHVGKEDLRHIFSSKPFTEFELEEARIDDNAIEGVESILLAAARVR